MKRKLTPFEKRSQFCRFCFILFATVNSVVCTKLYRPILFEKNSHNIKTSSFVNCFINQPLMINCLNLLLAVLPLQKREFHHHNSILQKN